MPKTAKLIVASTTSNNDLFHATRFFAPDAFAFLILDGTKIMVTGDLEYERAKKEARVDKIWLVDEFKKRRGFINGPTNPATPNVVLQLLREYGVDSVTVPGNFDLGMGDFLREHDISCAVYPSPYRPNMSFFPEREIKTTDEISAIETTQRTVEEVFLIARRELEEASVSSDGTLRKRNGEPLTVEYLRGVMNAEFARRECVSELGLIIAPGNQACDPHNFGLGPLRANEWIVFDIFPRHIRTRYFADMTRTVSKRRPPEPAVIIYKTVLEAQELGITMIREGVDGQTIQEAVDNLFQDRGFETGIINGKMQGCIHSVGHGVGLDIHEYPDITRSPCVLKSGHIVTDEPGLYYLDQGAVRIEDMVVVEKDGRRNLTQMPKDLEWAIIP